MVKLFNPLYRFARLDFEGGRATRAFRMKNALGFTYCRSSFCVSGLRLLIVPYDPFVPTPGHDP